MESYIQSERTIFDILPSVIPQTNPHREPPSEREVAFSQENDGRSVRNKRKRTFERRKLSIHAGSSTRLRREPPLGGSLSFVRALIDDFVETLTIKE